ncbi:GNAT family N-acetyltransferase [Polaribacter sp. 11A2H]|uniref:GNAT family N-acetyltransferase n=1 Tax=Polaribacter sp. 11A2H TaxID=2687290 RepID=UPI00140AFE8D|nr:GNAT family N-acetyltransferase [Polaribacter sp. 11A2H]
MGIKLTKETCSLSIEKLKTLKSNLELKNSNLNFIVTDKVISKYHDSFIQCHDEVRRFLIESFNEPISEVTIDMLIQIEKDEFFLKKVFALIISNNQVLGFQEVTIEGLKSVTLETMYLSKELRGKSLGKWLISAALINCIEKMEGLKLIETNVNEQNIPILKTLKPFGFYAKTSIDQLIKNIK